MKVETFVGAILSKMSDITKCQLKFIPHYIMRSLGVSRCTIIDVPAIPYMDIVVESAGRLKSPAIDFDDENLSIEGDFNRPAKCKTNVQ